MLSGRKALQRMDKTLGSARRDLERLELELQSTSRAVSQNKLEQARAIDRMAGIRLDASRRGEVVKYLQAATTEALEILGSRDAAIATINDRVRLAIEAIADLENRREAHHEEVDAAARTLAEREAAAQQYLEDDDAFQAQLERTREADAVAVSALEKAELARQDQKRKGEPYEGDELFMYLWNRGYGTNAYSANPLVRMLDGWVARLCRYQDARPNYWMLLEIPQRLAEHAEHARDAADTELDALQDIEERAAEDASVPAARAALEQSEQRQDELDTEIAAAEAGLAELQAEQHRYTAGEDDYMLRALRAISAAMERRDISELTRLARATLSAEDDAIVDELRHLRRQHNELQDELHEIRSLQRERHARIEELAKVRRDFKRSRYDDAHSQFDKGDLIERMIGEVIGGVIQGGALWNVLRRYQQYTGLAGEWPDFGSGGVVLGPGKRRKRKKRQRRPSWHWPGPSSNRRGGGFRLPKAPTRSRGRRRSRGGFRTGGGF